MMPLSYQDGKGNWDPYNAALFAYEGTTEDLYYEDLPRLREKLLEPLLLEEPDAPKKVAILLWNLNLEPKHLFVHMRLLQMRLNPKSPSKEIFDFLSSDDARRVLPRNFLMEFNNFNLESYKTFIARHPEEDLYELLSDRVKAQVIREYQILVTEMKKENPSEEDLMKDSGIRKVLRGKNGIVNDTDTQKVTGKRTELALAMEELRKLKDLSELQGRSEPDYDDQDRCKDEDSEP
mmetsp:Transcript_4295/g.6117  ORF Transcript_4295/g.6117 Transcript_4295/m.6117 type:complete len:235 (+) Transcript_4295:121-825(+)